MVAWLGPSWLITTCSGMVSETGRYDLDKCVFFVQEVVFYCILLFQRIPIQIILDVHFSTKLNNEILSSFKVKYGQNVLQISLTYIILWANQLTTSWYFSDFLQKIGFDMQETICMKCLSLWSVKN